MYTPDGIAVKMEKKIEGGYLARIIYDQMDYGDYDEDDEDAEPMITEYGAGDQLMFYPELSEHPLTLQYAKEVADLQKEAIRLSNEISDLREQKRSEEGLLNKIAKFPFIQKLVEYVTGDFEFILNLGNYEVDKKSQRYNGPFVKAMNVKDGGWGLYRLKSDNYSSGEDRPFLCFQTIEEVNAYVKAALLDTITAWKPGIYNLTHSFKEWYSKIHYQQVMKDDTEVVAAYKIKLDELAKIESQQQADALDKQMQELEERKRKLQNKPA